jgi:transcriptional regulator with XRE-family HTH domain
MRDLGKRHRVDVHVGTRIHQRRALLGLNQSQLGKAVGVTFQQIQKYERGSDRVGSSRLYEIAKVLDVPVAYFFDEIPSSSERSRKTLGKSSVRIQNDALLMTKRETLELVRAYYKVRQSRVRKGLVEMMRIIGAARYAQVRRGRKRRKSL